MANASFYGSAQQHSSHVPPPQGQPQQPPYSAQQPPPPTGYQPNPFAQNQQAYAQQPLACYPPQPAYQQPYPPQSNYPPQAPQQHPAQQGYQSHHVQPAYQTPPTIGYAVDINSPQILHRNVTREIEAIREATKGWGSDKKALISILAKADPLHMASIRYHYGDRFHTDLKELIRKETKGHFQDALVSLIQGPLESDVRNLRQALEGIGTKEALLNDVLVGRTNADLQIIKAEYRRIFKRSLEEDVSNDLSLETKRMFAIILSANKADETTEVSGDQVNTDVLALRQATKGKLVGTDQMAVFDILCRRSNGQIRAIAFAYEQKYLRSLDKMISKQFSGHMEDALLLIVNGAVDPAMCTADMIEDAMKGIGTKDTLLISRIIRCHWQPDHLDQVKKAYKHKYHRNLSDRVKSDTSGRYEDLLVACIE